MTFIYTTVQYVYAVELNISNIMKWSWGVISWNEGSFSKIPEARKDAKILSKN